MNALVDPTRHPRALPRVAGRRADRRSPFAASAACGPGVPGVSEKIRVSSVVGRFLEHSRAFSFGVGDEEEIYISSADWMPRNFYRRVELMVPILDEKAREKIRQEVLEP